MNAHFQLSYREIYLNLMQCVRSFISGTPWFHCVCWIRFEATRVSDSQRMKFLSIFSAMENYAIKCKIDFLHDSGIFYHFYIQYNTSFHWLHVHAGDRDHKRITSLHSENRGWNTLLITTVFLRKLSTAWSVRTYFKLFVLRTSVQ